MNRRGFFTKLGLLLATPAVAVAEGIKETAAPEDVMVIDKDVQFTKTVTVGSGDINILNVKDMETDQTVLNVQRPKSQREIDEEMHANELAQKEMNKRLNNYVQFSPMPKFGTSVIIQN